MHTLKAQVVPNPAVIEQSKTVWSGQIKNRIRPTAITTPEPAMTARRPKRVSAGAANALATIEVKGRAATGSVALARSHPRPTR